MKKGLLYITSLILICFASACSKNEDDASNIFSDNVDPATTARIYKSIDEHMLFAKNRLERATKDGLKPVVSLSPKQIQEVARMRIFLAGMSVEVQKSIDKKISPQHTRDDIALKRMIDEMDKELEKAVANSI